MHRCTVYRPHKLHFSAKIDPTILFTHLKIILLIIEGNGVPAMEVRLCSDHVSLSHDHGGPAMEVFVLVIVSKGELRNERDH